MKFRGKYWFLSNMYPTVVTFGKYGDFASAETAYQAFKDARGVATWMRNYNGFQAKKMGRSLPIRSDFNHIKIDLMREILRAKFGNPELMAMLKAVKGEIVEDNTWGDYFWGRCNGVGENHLGRLLMEIRDE